MLTLIFLSNPLFHLSLSFSIWTVWKGRGKKYKNLNISTTEGAFLDKIKNIFCSFWKIIIWQNKKKNKQRTQALRCLAGFWVCFCTVADQRKWQNDIVSFVSYFCLGVGFFTLLWSFYLSIYLFIYFCRFRKKRQGHLCF